MGNGQLTKSVMMRMHRGTMGYILITTISRRYAYNLRCVVLLTNLTYKPSNTVILLEVVDNIPTLLQLMEIVEFDK